MTQRTLSLSLRLLFSLPLLFLVWKRTHWSVALCLLLLTIGSELQLILLHRLIGRMEKLERRQRVQTVVRPMGPLPVNPGPKRS